MLSEPLNPSRTIPLIADPRLPERFIQNGSPNLRPPEPVKKTEQRVLVVDDEENVGLIVQQGLKKLPNYTVKLAQSAEQALAYCQESPFDLMITDYQMPGTDGIALALQIRKIYPQMVVLMLTAHNDDNLYRQAAQMAVQQILDKPVEIAEIREAVIKALEKGENTKR